MVWRLHSGSLALPLAPALPLLAFGPHRRRHYSGQGHLLLALPLAFAVGSVGSARPTRGCYISVIPG